MLNKNLYTLLALCFSLNCACETEQRSELTIHSLGGSKVVYPLELPLNLPDHTFNGHQLIKVNLRKNLSGLFTKIVHQFGFEHPNPLDIKFIPCGEDRLGEFQCLNSPTCTVRVRGSAESGKIFINVSGSVKLIGVNNAILPLIKFGKQEVPWDFILPRIREEIIKRKEVALQEYADIVQEHAGGYDPRFFPAYLNVDGCKGQVGCVGNSPKESSDSIYYAVLQLLDKLEEKAFFKVQKESLLFYNSMQRFSQPRMCEKPKSGDSIMSIFNNLRFVGGPKKGQEREKLLKTISDILSVKLAGPLLYEVFCPVEKAFLHFTSEVLILKISPEHCIQIGGDESFYIYHEDTIKGASDLTLLEEGYNSADLVNRIEQLRSSILEEEQEELLPGELEESRLYKALESIRPHIGNKHNLVLLLQFTLQDSSWKHIDLI